MARISNFVLATLNIIFLLAGVALLSSGVYFHVHGAATVCQKLIVNSLLLVGAFVFLISVLGLSGSCCKSNCLLGLYMILMFFMILGLIVFAIFVFLITNESAGKVVSGHRLGDYSHWLQNHFTKGKNWDVFKGCLVDAQFCNSLASNPTPTYSDFLNLKISPLQGGCCMPPRECGFEYRNATMWRVPKSGGREMNSGDCKAWSNKQNELCMNCENCKAGFLASIRKQWRNLGISFIILIVFIFIVLSVASCVSKNNSFDNRVGRYYGRSYA